MFLIYQGIPGRFNPLTWGKHRGPYSKDVVVDDYMDYCNWGLPAFALYIKSELKCMNRITITTFDY